MNIYNYDSINHSEGKNVSFQQLFGWRFQHSQSVLAGKRTQTVVESRMVQSRRGGKNAPLLRNWRLINSFSAGHVLAFCICRTKSWRRGLEFVFYGLCRWSVDHTGFLKSSSQIFEKCPFHILVENCKHLSTKNMDNCYNAVYSYFV